MVTFRNNNRRGRFRNNDRNYRRNGDNKFKSDFSSISNFKRKGAGRNNYNASKLVEKYNDLAREALANEDKIMSENYFQYADHFTRILREQENNRSNKLKNLSETDKKPVSSSEENQTIKEKKII